MDRIIAPRCQYRQNPLGIDVTAPKFSYRIASSRTGTAQSARRLQVSTR
jgi:alpha-L-rhamnosidase